MNATNGVPARQPLKRALILSCFQTLIVLLPGLPAVSFASAATAAAPSSRIVELHIASDGDNLAFTPSRLTCVTGARVKLVFHHSGGIIDDPHDWVLLKPGTLDRFVADADKQPDESVIPDKDLVIAATRLCDKGHTVSVEFTAPAPGIYPFVCSVPGHGASMHGVLIVTNQ
jgi:azurin